MRDATMSKLKIFILLNLIFLSSSKIKVDNGKFVDENGRERIFHGVNVVYKVPPYIPSDNEFDPFLSFNDRDIMYMKEYGFNLVRLGIMWEAVEISPGIYDHGLLEKYLNLVNKLGQNDIYTIIDSHQDILSRQTCGEGIPLFYIESINHDKDCSGSLLKKFLNLIGVCKPINEYGFRRDEKGLPLIEDCQKHSFAVYNTSPEITSLYSKLYNNEQGFLDKYIAFLSVVAKKFKGNEYILGFDLWNEPFPGGLFDNPIHNLTPGKPDDEQLIPFYRKIDESLRKIDEDYVMMYENMPFPDFLPLFIWNFKGGFSQTPLPQSQNNKQIYNYHSYCCNLSMTMCASGESPIEQSNNCRDYHMEHVKEANVYTKKFGIGSIISEFGACFNTLACFNEISSVADAADKYLTSWAYWMYKPFNDFTTSCIDNKEGIFEKDGSIQEYKVKALSRSYVQAFQGSAISMKFDTFSKNLIFSFKLNKNVEHPTIIYLNKKLNYNDGYKLISSKAKGKIDNSDDNLLKIKYDAEDIINDEIVTVILSKKDFSFDGKELTKFLEKSHKQLLMSVFYLQVEEE
jgi:endoglycosylceramidase